MKINKLKILAGIGLGIPALILVNKIIPINGLKNGQGANEINPSSESSITPHFDFSKGDEYSDHKDLNLVSETSTEISVIPEKGKMVKSRRLEANQFLVSEVDRTENFPVSSGIITDPFLSVHWDYFKYAPLALIGIFWFNFPNPFYYLRNFPSVFFHCGQLWGDQTIRPTSRKLSEKKT